MKTISMLVTAMALNALACYAQPVAQWRGPGRSGVYQEKNLLKSWPEGGPTLLWKSEIIGNGYGSPTITDERIYIMGEIDSTGYLFAFTHKGELLWKSGYGKEWVVNYQGSRCAPTVVGDLVYVCSGLGSLSCFDAVKGEKKWSVDMLKDLHGRLTLFGHAESPLVEGEKVFLVPGGKDTNVVALNRFNGQVVWTCKGQGEIPGYNSPCMANIGDRNILVTFTAYSLLGIDAQTGGLIWFHAQDNVPVPERKPGNGDTHSNTVLYENGCIYYFAGDGNGAVKLRLSPDGKEITQVWRNKTIDNYMGGIVKLGNYLYSCVSEKKQLKCVDPGSGQVVGIQDYGTGSVISADNMLCYYNQKGEVRWIRPSGGDMVQAGFFKVTSGAKEHFSHPVIDKGVLYIRHGTALMAYDILAK